MFDFFKRHSFIFSAQIDPSISAELEAGKVIWNLVPVPGEDEEDWSEEGSS